MTEQQLQEILKQARKKKGLTHAQVALSVNGNLNNGKTITRQYYGMIEKCIRTPSVDVAKAIGKVLEVEWTIFFNVNSNQTLRGVGNVGL